MADTKPRDAAQCAAGTQQAAVQDGGAHQDAAQNGDARQASAQASGHGASVLEQDVHLLSASSAFDGLVGSRVLVTGATGLIGSLFVKGLLAYNDAHDAGIRVVALVRSRDKAAAVFAGFTERADLEIVAGDIVEGPRIDGPIDWISHGASITASALFAARPVEVALTELEGTREMLELARSKQVKGMVYLSSLEVYGDIPREHGEVCESDCGFLDRFSPRNSYPVAKRMCECLCAAYASEYGVPVKIARLAQTFGAGVDPSDNRVFAYFARAVLAGDPIVMHTPGEGCRCYCYSSDAVAGIACIMAKGIAGQAYNVANPATYCSAREMAEMVADRYADSGVTLKFDIPDDVSAFGFAAPSFVKLNADKLQSLGWKPRYDLPEMYDRLIADMRQANEAGR